MMPPVVALAASGEGAVSVNELTPTTFCSPDSMRRTRSAWALHEPAFHGVDHRERAAAVEYPLQLGLGRADEFRDLGLDDLRSFEQVAVFQQVGFEREHLLDAQRPLLVPRCRQAERFVPTRKLDGPRARVLRERDAQHLEHDALHVVLGLFLGEAERVHLHAITEAA